MASLCSIYRRLDKTRQEALTMLSTLFVQAGIPLILLIVILQIIYIYLSDAVALTVMFYDIQFCEPSIFPHRNVLRASQFC